MVITESLLPAAPNPVLMLALLLAVMYLARKSFHRTILGSGRVARNALRLCAAFLGGAEEKIIERNTEVLVARGLECSEGLIEREFGRIEVAVTRELKGYAVLQRRVAEVITTLEEDHARSVEVPPDLPNWTDIIASVADIKHGDNAVVARVLEEIGRNLGAQNRSAIEAFRHSSAARHALLTRMMPLWRKVQKSLNNVAQSIETLTDRAKVVERNMKDYLELRSGNHRAVRKLSSSASTRFLVAGLFLLVAVGGSIVNFNLIAMPMSEITGSGSFIGPYRTAEVVALVMILIELSLGIYLMETLRITRLFPLIGAMDDRLRRRMAVTVLALLAALAGVASALAFLRDRIVADMAALHQTLAGVEQAVQTISSVSTVAQMAMAFTLPFVLALTAIPLESFIHATRIVMGNTVASMLRLTAFVLRLAGNLICQSGRLATNLYDLIIFPLLWLESVVSAEPLSIKKTLEKLSRTRPPKGTTDTVDKKDGRATLHEGGK